MRMLYVSEATGWCGGANQIWLTATRLIRRGHDVAVACREGFQLSGRLKDSGVPVVNFAPRQDYDVFGARRLARIARDWGAELVHAHHPRAHALALLATLFGLGAPLIVTRRVIKPVGRNPFSALKYASRRVTRYVAVCDASAQELEHAGVERTRISVIPSGVDFSLWETARAARAALPADGRRVVAMVGHYSAIKGHETLLEAIPLVHREFPGTVFRIAGRGTEGLRLKADRLGLNGEVELLGERNDVPELLSQSHLYVMPSLQEGIGTACIEAHAAEVPVVASRVGGLPQVVEDGRTGLLVTPGDPAALADAIVASLRRPERAAEMARAGYGTVLERFSIDAVVSRLEELYRSVA
ncbi:MAG: glycosyltransferase family 4 protein [Elusimicrobia bacterium]|nr:glycosyltransferase family 4 protein [Elusimicrobiota bacterium]